MTTNINEKDKAVKKGKTKYSAPVLVKYGTVKSLTMGGVSGGKEGKAMSPKVKS